jgi:competence ComEA-like helix-hairpin-helix protein
MGGREARATLLFVLVSLIVGAAYRSWVGPDGPTFVERLRAMEETSDLHGERGADARALAGGSPSYAGSVENPGATDAPTAARGANGADGAARRSPRGAPLGRLDVDRATAAEFERLPGIGPALAARIVADRASKGPFSAPDGLLRVRGIGPKTLDRLRPFLRGAVVDSTPPFAK